MLNKVLLQPKRAFKLLYPKAIWNIKTEDKVLYLTFDDGPIPELTDWVLDVLKSYQIKATFFCVGNNIEKHPDVYRRIINEGHLAANHTYNHLKGFKTKTADYLVNTNKCETLTQTKLFRPPYGQLKPPQYKILLENGYKIVMWDVISYDYEKINGETCFLNVKKNAKPGSIILFHDNIKAAENIKYALPKTIDYFLKLNYTFASLSCLK